MQLGFFAALKELIFVGGGAGGGWIDREVLLGGGMDGEGWWWKDVWYATLEGIDISTRGLVSELLVGMNEHFIPLFSIFYSLFNYFF